MNDKRFENLPTDIILQILMFLSLRDLGSMVRVSPFFRSFMKNPIVQKEIDTLLANVWLKKIHQELTTCPPNYHSKRAEQYKNFYNENTKLINVENSYSDIYNFFSFDHDKFEKILLRFTINKMDIALKKFLEKYTTYTRNTYCYSRVLSFLAISIQLESPELFNVHFETIERHGHPSSQITTLVVPPIQSSELIKFDNDEANNLLHIASMSENIYYAKKLLELGGNLYCRNNDNQNCYSLAFKHNKELFKHLMKYVRAEDLKMMDHEFIKKYRVSRLCVLDSMAESMNINDQASKENLNKDEQIRKLTIQIEAQKQLITILKQKLNIYEQEKHNLNLLSH